MDINEFLRNMGMKDDQPANPWDRVIQPNSSYLIVGDVGTGKSALAYYLLETFSQRYELTPAVVGLPRDKRLLPDNFALLDDPSQCTELENAIIFIDEADLQLPIEDSKARKYVVNFLSLPRHRNQIFLLAFHFPRLVMGRYLPFFSAFLLKRPPYLLEFASKSKGDALNQMMEKAEERFRELPSNDDIVKNTYIVAPRIRWQGMLGNPLCSFWTEPLSEVWAGTEISSPAPSGKYPVCQKFLAKLSINGFSVEERDNRLTLRPSGDVLQYWQAHGYQAMAKITIEEVEPHVWKVVDASGRYARVAYGKKKGYFEEYINRWAWEAWTG